MSNEESMAAAAVASRRVPRQGVGGSPVGSTLSIVLAVVAVIAGFLILRNITDDGGSGSADDGTELIPLDTETTVPEGAVVETTVVTVPTSTTIPKVVDGATVAVANANTVGGSAGDMTKTLELEGYTMGSPVNATGPNIDDSIIYYDPTVAASLDVANSVARDLGGVSVLTVVSPAPTESGDLGDAAVLVLLGNNEAGKSVAELTAEAADAADEAAVDTAEAPEVAGTDDATTDDATTDEATTDEATTDEATTDE